MLARLAVPLVFLACTLQASPYSAFKDGEKFTYRASWGLFTKAGEIKIRAAKETLNGKPVFRLTVVTETKGVVSGFYRYEDTAEALIDAETGRIISSTEQASNSEKLSDAITRFDYVKRLAVHEDKLRPGRNREFAIPEGDAIDLISALVQTRDWAKEPGIKRDALIFAGRDIYPVTIYAEGYERVYTPKGEQEALVLVPRMEKDAPRGIFKKGGEIKVWVSRNAERLPIKMQLKLKFGTASLHLTEHSIATQPAASQNKK
jgi:hypothetical protein